MNATRQIACVEREIGQRKRVYARLVAQGKMTQRLADAETAAMEAVLATLEAAAEFAQAYRRACADPVGALNDGLHQKACEEAAMALAEALPEPQEGLGL